MGTNPEDDLAMGLKNLRTALMSQQVTHPTADLMLTSFLKSHQFRSGAMGKSLRSNFLEQQNLRVSGHQIASPEHSETNLRLSEIALRVRLGKISDDYQLRAYNPENPFKRSNESCL